MEWKSIQGYTGLYEVNECGDVRSVDREVKGRNGIRKIKGKVVTPFISNGYVYVKLYKHNKGTSYRVHRIVIKAFEPIDNDKILDVNHIDGNKCNNSIDNLEWCTRKENLDHAVRIGLNKQAISVIARKDGRQIKSASINGLYDILIKEENILCKRHTFQTNVCRAIKTHGNYYGYEFEKVVI